MAIDRDALVDLLSRLVSTPSINPVFARRGDPSGEVAAAELVARELEAIGMQVFVREAAPGRPSVVGLLAGSGGGRSLMLNGHLDTVGIEGMESPFEPIVRDGRLYGRGAYDMKAGVAACIAAARDIAESGQRLAGDLLVSAVSDEEVASIGSSDVAEVFATDGVVVTEPTGLQIAVAHRGFAWIKVTTRGFACHGSRYDLGIDANMMMGRFLARLEALGREILSRPASTLAGPASLHASAIHGGEGLSVYSPSCELRFEWRTAPGETAEAVMGQVRALLDELSAEDPKFEADAELLLFREPFAAAEPSAVVESLASAFRQVRGREAEIAGVRFWTDAAVFRSKGADVALLGHDGAGAHETIEYADLASVEALAETLAACARIYCSI